MEFVIKKLNGRPRCVKIRAIRYSYPKGDPSGCAVKEVPIRAIPVFCDIEESSDFYFTPWGECKEATVYDYTRGGRPRICGSYVAQFDKHHNLVRSRSEYTTRRRMGSQLQEVETRVEEHKVFYTYDDTRPAIREDRYRKNGMSYVSLTEYDAQGQPVWERDGHLHTLYRYESGRLATKEKGYVLPKASGDEGRFDCTLRESYHYDPQGRLTRKEAVRADGSPFYTIQMEYDAQGTLRSKTSRYYSIGEVHEANRTTYKDGVMVFVMVRKGLGEKWMDYRIQQVDAHGMITDDVMLCEHCRYNKRTKRWTKKRTLKHYTYDLSYDAQGNWTRRVLYKDGKKSYAHIREIEYY